MHEKAEVAVVGIDIGKSSFHVVGLSARGEILLRQKWSRPQARRLKAPLLSALVPLIAASAG